MVTERMESPPSSVPGESRPRRVRRPPEYRIMPQAAIDTGCVDLTVALNRIGKTLTQLFAKGKPKHG
jgi:chemotaxis response regulator CheB